MPKDKQKKAERKKKAGKKESQFAIRVQKAERDAFVALCDQLDTSAAREIRRFMREFVAAHAAQHEAPPASPAPDATSAVAPEAPAAAPRRRTRAPVTGSADGASGDTPPKQRRAPRNGKVDPGKAAV